MSYKRKYKKDSFTEKKRKAWNRGKRTQTPFTITEGLAATNKVYGCWLFLQGALSLMFDRILNATLSEKVSTTGVIQENLEFPLLLNSFDSHQTQNTKMKLWTGPTFLLPWTHQELTHLVDKAKNVWLIVGQFPIKPGWWDAPLVHQDFSWSNKETIFPSNTVATLMLFNYSA